MKVPKLPLKPLIGIGLVVLIAAVAGIAVSRGRGAAPGAQAVKAQYYCPMHPTYTSDRPGDCPICSMRLVKREAEPAQTAPPAKSAESICYLHNCAKIHEGRPCPMTVVAQPGETVICPICGKYVAGEGGALRKVLYWTDPMIPGYRSEKPGKSPMGMDLVPMYAEAAGAESAGASAVEGYSPVLLTPQKQQLIGVTTARAKRQRLVKTIRAAGTIAHDPELYQAQTEYLQAAQALAQARQTASADVIEQAQRLVDSARVRLRHLGLSEALIDEIAMWPEAQRGLLYAAPGEPVWVYAHVYEYELPLVQTGQRLQVNVPALGGETFEGAVRAIDQLVDPLTRTVRVRATLENPEGRLKPAMYAGVSIAVDLGEALAVPDAAVFATGERNIVFVDKGQGLFEPRDVTLGTNVDGFSEVKAGVAEGEAVVTSGNFLIDSESRLKAALRGAAGAGHQHGQ